MPTMNSDQNRAMPGIVAWFGGLGIVPFAVGAVFSNVPETADFGRWIVIGYGAVILSFLGGIQWGVALKAAPRGFVAYVVSIAISLTGWVAMLLDPLTGLAVLGGGFVTAVLYDVSGAGMFQLPRWFVPLRLALSASVLACLAAAAYPLLP